MVARLILLATFCASLDAAADALLARVRQQVSRNLERLPNYTCLETIDRTVRERPHPARSVDRLRLEVAYVGGRELVAWPGEGKFAERRVAEMIGESAALSSGDFALSVSNLFGAASASFSAPVEGRSGDRKTIRWDFRVPAGATGMRVGTLAESALVPYHGTFWVDAETLDLIRLEQSADQIPKRTKVSASESVIEYARSRIGDSDFLLPVFSELMMTDNLDHEYRNRVQFTGCHQFVGESSISFADPAPVAAPSPEEARPVVLEDGLMAETALETDIDLGSAAIGDPVRAVLTRPLRRGKEVVYPPGAKLQGRITRLQKRAASDGRLTKTYYVVGLRFSDLAGAGMHSGFLASLEELWPHSTAYSIPFKTDSLPLDAILGPLVWQEVHRSVPRPERGEGVFLAVGKSPRLSPKLRLVWRTLPAR